MEMCTFSFDDDADTKYTEEFLHVFFLCNPVAVGVAMKAVRRRKNGTAADEQRTLFTSRAAQTSETWIVGFIRV